MILMILGFLFVYWFIIGLYYIITHDEHSNNKDIYEIEPIMSKPTAIDGVALEEAGRIYSDIINIPIIDDSSDLKDSEIPMKENPEDLIICKVCQRSLPEDSKFCIYCGTKI
ncbi:MAG: zinc-ribbon domain-containing protein [Candidatus Helarchaeota archaeon]